MAEIFAVLLGSALVNNILFEHAVGVDPALSSMARQDVAYGMSRTMLVLLPLVAVLSSIMIHHVLVPMQLEYMRTFVLVLLVMLCVYALKSLAGRYAEKYSKSWLLSDLQIFLPLAGVNTTVIGTLLLNQQDGHHWFLALVFGLGTAVGFSITLIPLSFINQRLGVTDVPLPFKGIPIILVTLGLLSMAFLGFMGMGR